MIYQKEITDRTLSSCYKITIRNNWVEEFCKLQFVIQAKSRIVWRYNTCQDIFLKFLNLAYYM